MSSLRSLTIKLQKKSSDILAAYEHVSEVITDLELLKTNCEEEFHLWYCEIKTLTEELNILIATPRITLGKFIAVTFQLTVQRHTTEETL